MQTYGPQYPDQVYAITVGSETLYRGNFTGDQLALKIQDVKSAVPQFKVGTADSWTKYDDKTADPVIKSADIVYVNLASHLRRTQLTRISRLANAFGYWQGQEINNASATFFDDIGRALARVQSVKGSVDGIEFMVGETGKLLHDARDKRTFVVAVNVWRRLAQCWWNVWICKTVGRQRTDVLEARHLRHKGLGRRRLCF